MTLTFDLLTFKVVSESHVTWTTSVPISVFVGLSVLDLGPMYATDRHTSDSIIALCPAYYGRGHNNDCEPKRTVNYNKHGGEQSGLVTLTFDLLTLKVVSESRVSWTTSVPISVFLGLSVLDLGPMYATYRQTDVR